MSLILLPVFLKYMLICLIEMYDSFLHSSSFFMHIKLTLIFSQDISDRPNVLEYKPYTRFMLLIPLTDILK